MSIFGVLKFEPVLQMHDKARLEADKSYISKGEAEISLIEVDPDGSGFVDVTGSDASDWFLDWQYSTAGLKTVSLRITTDGAPEVFTGEILVLTAAEDNLYSNDDDLLIHEPDILDWLKPGKTSYKNYHRRAQALIVDEVNNSGRRKSDRSRYNKNDILITEDVKEWSTYMTLKIIQEGISNEVDDIFQQKAAVYHSKGADKSSPALLSLDKNGDGVLGEDEKVQSYGHIQAIRL